MRNVLAFPSFSQKEKLFYDMIAIILKAKNGNFITYLFNVGFFFSVV